MVNLDGGVLATGDHLVFLLIAPVDAVDLAQVGSDETHSRGWLLWRPPTIDNSTQCHNTHQELNHF